nr:hypothetical protein [Chitinimonas koreensis]
MQHGTRQHAAGHALAAAVGVDADADLGDAAAGLDRQLGQADQAAFAVDRGVDAVEGVAAEIEPLEVALDHRVLGRLGEALDTVGGVEPQQVGPHGGQVGSAQQADEGGQIGMGGHGDSLASIGPCRLLARFWPGVCACACSVLIDGAAQ